jgi:hypothetical protein
METRAHSSYAVPRLRLICSRPRPAILDVCYRLLPRTFRPLVKQVVSSSMLTIACWLNFRDKIPVDS